MRNRGLVIRLRGLTTHPTEKLQRPWVSSHQTRFAAHLEPHGPGSDPPLTQVAVAGYDPHCATTRKGDGYELPTTASLIAMRNSIVIDLNGFWRSDD
jgi:hypothetical protein